MDNFSDVERYRVKNTSKKPFKFNNQRVLLTYKTHIDKKDLEEKHRDIWKNEIQIDFWRAAHEVASSETNYEHTHVVIEFNKAMQTSNCRIFDYNDIHPHIRLICSKTHAKRAKRYLSKEDPANEDLKSIDCTLLERICDYPDVKKMLDFECKNPLTAGGLITLYGFKSSEIKRDEIKLFKWQEKLIEELKGKADDRKVIWIYDELGRTGKTKLIEWAHMNLKNDVYAMTSMPGERDTAMVIKNAKESGWNCKILLINLTRTQNERMSLYQPLESLKDGWITSTKYSGSTVWLTQIPHIVVFSNWYPKTDMMTADRWDIRAPKGTRKQYDWGIGYEDLNEITLERWRVGKASFNMVDFERGINP